MSGGFFRGTSTDQDTRFSNKKAKLLKSQKFPSELETLVDMTKVKMDVMRPWIAKRVTELIGFEDEVLINFIYGLLEGKEVNGKEVQISLTGFMERNTGKFMKELWLLLLSAQQNLSGVPQQFLDAKEQETKKKKAETDRIANEIQKKKEKEKQELEQEKFKMDGDGGKSRDKPAELEQNLKPDSAMPNNQPEDEKSRNKRKDIRGRRRDSRSPDLADHSASPRKKSSTPPIKSFSYSRSYSGSQSVSRSPSWRSRSISSERRHPSLSRQSSVPRRKRVVHHSPSPPRHRSSHYKRRSVSISRRRSPSPIRHRERRYDSRSPLHHGSRSLRRRSRTPVQTSSSRRRSPSPVRRGSPSPLRRRSPSPLRRRSPSPLRRRSPSPLRRRSPSPLRRRSPSPMRRRSPSPMRRRTPIRGRSPYFVRRRSLTPPSDRSLSPRYHRPRSPLRKPLHRQSPAPVKRRDQRSPSSSRGRSPSPVLHRSSMLSRKRSFTPPSRRSKKSSSSSPIRQNSFSPARRESPRSMRSPPQSPGERIRSHEKHASARYPSPGERTELLIKNNRGSKPTEHRPTISLRSPQRDMLDRDDFRGRKPATSLSKRNFPTESDAFGDRGYQEDRRSSSPQGSIQRREGIIRPRSPSPKLKASGIQPHRDSSGTSDDDIKRESRDQTYKFSKKLSPSNNLTETAKTHDHDEFSRSRKSQLTTSEMQSDQANHSRNHEILESSGARKTSTRIDKGRESYITNADKAGIKHSALADDSIESHLFQEPEDLPKTSRKSELHDQNGSRVSPIKGSDDYKTKVEEKRKHRKSDRHEVESDDYSSDDSYEERKEAKRRRKEEKKLKREERRRRRDERHHRKEERRMEKRKLRSINAGHPSSDLGKDHSEDENDQKRESRKRGDHEVKSAQKNLEIELREKALESLRAKKGIGNSKN